mmetsp:Transcript_11538/g.37857  ORF Transcript_11538/g.37857 Transcript_11538/m.37857 type:complete len:261 (+) Transcript_11538:1212-1994(+)
MLLRSAIRMLRSVEEKSLVRHGTTRVVNSSAGKPAPHLRRHPSADAGAEPYSSPSASAGRILRWSTGTGSLSSVLGRRLKKLSFSAASLSVSFSKNAVVSTSLFWKKRHDSRSLEGLSRRLGCDPSRRWYSLSRFGGMSLTSRSSSVRESGASRNTSWMRHPSPHASTAHGGALATASQSPRRTSSGLYWSAPNQPHLTRPSGPGGPSFVSYSLSRSKPPSRQSSVSVTYTECKPMFPTTSRQSLFRKATAADTWLRPQA